jgi:hypothetical protein
MSEPVNHHYLPIFYLRQWCAASGKLIRFHKPYNKVIASAISPRSTGYEPFLYSLEGCPAQIQQDIEKRFFSAIVDDPAARAMKILIDRQKEKLTPELRTAWTRFLMAVRVRTPEMVKKIAEVALKHLEENLARSPEEYIALRKADDPPTAMEWMRKRSASILDNIGKLFLPGLIENEKIGDALINMKWATVDLSTSEHDLLTSDRPYIQTLGLPDEKCVIGLPLTPRLLFVATHYDGRRREMLAHGMTRIAKAVNSHVASQAVRHVYGASCSQMRFVERRFGLHPRKEPLS